MNALIICDSLYGNTYEVAEALAAVWRQYIPVRIVTARTATVPDLIGVELLAIGGPTQIHGLSPAMDDLLGGALPTKMAGKTIVAFDTRIHLSAWLSGSAAEVIAKRLSKHGLALLVPPESFFVEGKEGPLREGELDHATMWAHTVFEKATVSPVAAANV